MVGGVKEANKQMYLHIYFARGGKVSGRDFGVWYLEFCEMACGMYVGRVGFCR